MRTKLHYLKVLFYFVAIVFLMSGSAFAGRQGNENQGNHLGQNFKAPEPPEIERVWPGDPDKLLLIGLNLTEEQKGLIKDAVAAYWTEVKDIKLQIIQREAELIEMFLNEGVIPPDNLILKQTEISTLKAQLDMKKLELLITIKGISPELADMLILKQGGFPPGHHKFENGLPPGQDD